MDGCPIGPFWRPTYSERLAIVAQGAVAAATAPWESCGCQVLNCPSGADSQAGMDVPLDVPLGAFNQQSTMLAAPDFGATRVNLPNCQQALIDPRKVTGYALDPGHDEGQHKAHLFETMLGINQQNAELLVDAVEKAAVTGEAVTGKLDKYGQRYVIDFAFTGPGGTATIRSAWIIRSGEDFPRLVTCYILYS